MYLDIYTRLHKWAIVWLRNNGTKNLYAEMFEQKQNGVQRYSKFPAN